MVVEFVDGLTMKLYVYLFVVFFSVGGCSVGPYEEPEDPQVPEGPGVLTGDSGEFSFADYKRKREKKIQDEAKELATQQGYYYSVPGSAYSGPAPAIDENSFEEFELFKAWRRAQDPSSPEHRDFQDWRAFQEYRRYKASQEYQDPEPKKAPESTLK